MSSPSVQVTHPRTDAVAKVNFQPIRWVLAVYRSRSKQVLTVWIVNHHQPSTVGLTPQNGHGQSALLDRRAVGRLSFHRPRRDVYSDVAGDEDVVPGVLESGRHGKPLLERRTHHCWIRDRPPGLEH